MQKPVSSPPPSPIIASKSQSHFPTSTIFLLLLLTLLALLLAYLRLKPQPHFTSYDDCFNHPQSLIRESFPPVCVTYTGLEFIAPTPTPPLPTPTLNPIPSGWHTFHHQDFTLSLPPDWQSASIATSSAATTYTFNPSPPTSTSGELSLNLRHTSTTTPLLEYLTTTYQLTTNPTISTQSASLDNKPAFFLTTPTQFILAAAHPTSGNIIEIIHPQTFSDHAQLADQILTTFRFTSLLQSCPEAWYQNQMPQLVPTPESYFIYNGKRLEADQVDIPWVIANCDQTEPEVVY